ncbi:hypothetical protein [Actinomadura madurae]|nr:hypothetical protein [Actinomadura madurae]MCP9977981.1 hypothetical protein [Actinomadura madurae]
MISARCTRHWPRNGSRPGWDSHQRVSALVHSVARRTSSVSPQASIRLQ